MVDISKFKFAQYNPRKISPAALDLLATSIREHTRAVAGWDPRDGFRLTATITVNANGNRVIGGHQRIAALRDVLGQSWIHSSDITYVELEPDSPEEKALNLALNARDAQGDFDWHGVSDLLNELNRDGFDMALTGFAPETLNPLLEADWSPPKPDPNADNSREDNSGDEWYTPPAILDLARRVLGVIDLDPASCDEAQKTVQAKVHYTRETNGLAHPWSGRVWLNPPYSMPLVKLFTERLLAEHRAGKVSAALCLTNNATDTDWLQALLAEHAACFFNGRVSFQHPSKHSGSPRQGQVLFYLGDDTPLFVDVFSAVGAIVQRLAT